MTIEDSLGLQSSVPTEPDERTDQVRGRLDAVLIAARVAPLTRHIGLVPTAVVTHTEPFHLSKAIATLDYVSGGRAGPAGAGLGPPDEAALFGRRSFAAVPVRGLRHARGTARLPELFDEAADYVEVVRRLWDSWEDDAEIRDVATGRFVDRDEAALHRLRGAAVQRQGPVDHPAAAAGPAARRRAGARERALPAGRPLGRRRLRHPARRRPRPGDRRRDPRRAGRGGARRGDRARLRRPGGLPRRPDAAAAARRARLDERAGAEFGSDALIFTGTPDELADLLPQWQAAGLTGFRLRPAALPHDLEQITRRLVPELQRRGAFRTAYEAGTLRGLLGLPRPANRYAPASAPTATGV